MNDFPLSEHLQTLAAGYVLGDLSSEEMVQFQQLLVNHPELAHTVASLQETLLMLPHGLSPGQPDTQVRAKLLINAKDHLSPVMAPLPQSPVSQSPLSQPPLSQPRHLLWSRRVAASVAIALGGFSLWLTHRVVTLQTQLALVERSVVTAVANGSSPDPALTISPAHPFLTQQWSGLLYMVDDHLVSLERSQGPVDVATANPNALSAHFSLAEQIPTLASPRAKLLGGSSCQFGEARGVRLTYQLPTEQTVSVYQIDLNGDQFPEFSQTYITLKHHNVNLILWREQDYLYALVAKLPLADLQTLTQAMEMI